MRAHHDRGGRSGDDPAAHFRAMIPFLTAQLSTGEYPHLAAAAGDDPAASFARLAHMFTDDERFERGLQRVLDGLERWVERLRRTGGPPAGR